jgi:hypothetical protein
LGIGDSTTHLFLTNSPVLPIVITVVQFQLLFCKANIYETNVWLLGLILVKLTSTASRENPFVPVGCCVSRAWVLIWQFDNYIPLIWFILIILYLSDRFLFRHDFRGVMNLESLLEAQKFSSSPRGTEVLKWKEEKRHPAPAPAFSKRRRVSNLGGICYFEHASQQGYFEEYTGSLLTVRP